jgi:lipopolysaccharide transport system ATP-binding protein
MSENAIVVENLSKRYLIGHRASGHYKYTALRDVVAREVRNFSRKAVDLVRGRQVMQGDEVEEFWALKDISFEVKQGEVLGIIGRNGAGKSTLLKILSRITEPTEGRVTLHGRVSSLLEVGTGFHPELTGRENIFLNGAILGMTQREIRAKFDEIVAFAEVEKFLDTPVKHYSSGMYVRLAFAVAAHLEPEILIVDEVLAVGDLEFQKKCLGKMDEVSRRQGRTVLFVSHNMEAVLKLCTRGVFLAAGSINGKGEAKAVVSSYLSNQSSSPRVVDLSSKKRPEYFPGRARVTTIAPSDAEGSWVIPFGKPLAFDVAVTAEPSVTTISVEVGVFSSGGFEVASWSNKCDGNGIAARPGETNLRIEFEDLRLLPGRYSLGIGVWSERGFEDWVEAALFEVIASPASAAIHAQDLGGALLARAAISAVN